MVATLLLVRLWTHDDAMAALMGVSALVPYYFLLFLLRDKLCDKFSFAIV